MGTPDAVDPEDVAALLDGKLSDAERDALLERLLRSPEGWDMFAESARLLRDDDPGEPELVGSLEALETVPAGADAVAIPVPPPPPVGAPALATAPSMARRRRRRLWIPVVAALALALLVPFALRRGGGAGLRLNGATLVSDRGGGSLDRALGREWDEPGWTVMRGGRTVPADPSAEFRIGVRLVDVEVALDAHDSVAVQRVQPKLQELLVRRQVPASLVAEYEDIGSRAADPSAKLSRDRKRAAAELEDEFRDSPAFAAGKWVEQARLAARAGNTDLFDARFAASGAKIIAAMRAKQMDAAFVQALEQVHARVRGGVEPGEQLDALTTELKDAIRIGGG